MQQIRIDGVSKRFDDYLALDRVTLDVEGGEFLSILGPSGCGKSTLLRIIAGLEAPSDGDVHIAGKRVTGDPVWKREIGFVFQNFALWPHLSVFRNVSMGLELRKVPKAEIETRVREVLRLVQLDALANRLPAQLSGGQQQRVALARAVVLKPKVLLLDEPLSALDKNLRQDMQVELKSLQRSLGLTSIFVTHDQEEALSLSDRVVVMNKGVIEQVGTPPEIYSTPRTEYVAGFVGEACFFHGTVEAGNILRLADGATVPLAAPAQTGAKIAAFVRPEWIKLAPPSGGDAPVGVFERLIYFGQSSDHLVRLGDRQIRVKHRDGDRAFATGENVALICKAWPLAAGAKTP